MQYRQLGSSGLRVPVLGLGCSTFGPHESFGNYNDEAGSLEIVDRACELGVNFLDTADMYAQGVSEQYIGKAIKGRREQFLIASKVGMTVGSGPNDRGLSRAHIMESIEGSLRRLGTDHVDLYYAHKYDPTTPTMEVLCAFDDLVRQGKTRYVGCSNYPSWQVARAKEVAQHSGMNSFVVSQSPYNLLNRKIEEELIPCCLNYGMGIVAYAPLAQGALTGKYRPGSRPQPGTRAWNNPSKNLQGYLADENLLKVERLEQWAKDRGHEVAELALAWALAKPAVSMVLAAVTSTRQLETNVKATEWQLTEEEVKEVEEIVGHKR